MMENLSCRDEEDVMSLSKIYKKNQSSQEAIIRPYNLNRSIHSTDEIIITAESVSESPSAGMENRPIPAQQRSSQSNEDTEQSRLLRQKITNLEDAGTQLNYTSMALAAAIEEISRLKKTILINSTEDMLRLVMAISRKVIQCETSMRDDIIQTVVKQALQAAIKSDEFSIKVNPEDFALVNEKKPLFLTSISGLNNITFEADPEISRGGCLIESDVGQVDATIETKLDEIHQQLLTSINKNNGTSG